MKFGTIIAAMLALAAPASANLITFDEPEAGPPGVLSTDPYSLDGLTFTSPYTHGVWYPAPSQNARDGTNVFENGYSDLTITSTNTQSFVLDGFDFGAGIYGDPPYDVTFMLTLFGGGTQTTTASATGQFQHVDFGGARVTSLVISERHGWIAIDNLSFSGVPEPASWALMLGGFGLVGGRLRRSRRRGAFVRA